jgi:prepilin-type N-terminal cleavage/methylation domain-containing protein
MQKYRHTNQHAFTLIEIIVSLGIFAVVATVALGALVKIVSANKKAQTIQAAVTNINYALDAMSREMRVGKNYYCANIGGGNINSVSPGNNLVEGDYVDSVTSNDGTKCPNGIRNDDNGTILAFNSTRVDPNNGNPCNLIYAYLFYKEDNGYSLNKAEQDHCNSNSYQFSSIIDPNVTITGYYVKVVATALPGGNPFPRATIRISGFAGVTEKDKTYFDIQTTISARVQ